MRRRRTTRSSRQTASRAPPRLWSPHHWALPTYRPSTTNRSIASNADISVRHVQCFAARCVRPVGLGPMRDADAAAIGRFRSRGLRRHPLDPSRGVRPDGLSDRTAIRVLPRCRRAPSLYGSLPDQLWDTNSFTRRLQDILVVRARYRIATGVQLDVPAVIKPGVARHGASVRRRTSPGHRPQLLERPDRGPGDLRPAAAGTTRRDMLSERRTRCWSTTTASPRPRSPPRVSRCWSPTHQSGRVATSTTGRSSGPTLRRRYGRHGGPRSASPPRRVPAGGHRR